MCEVGKTDSWKEREGGEGGRGREREVEVSIGYEMLRVSTKGDFSLLRICQCQI
jgi:hypothetical protein